MRCRVIAWQIVNAEYATCVAQLLETPPITLITGADMQRFLMLVCLNALSFCCHADDVPAGKYSGSYRTPVKGTTVQVALNVLSVENGKIDASLQRFTASGRGVMDPCDGTYPAHGMMKDDEIDIRAEAGGRAGDCRPHFRGRLEGQSLVGKFGQNDIRLTR